MKAYATLNLVVSMEVKQVIEDFIAKFSDLNVKGFNLQAELMDGSIHNVKVEDHFIKEWELDEDE